jgi:hypothetical protein
MKRHDKDAATMTRIESSRVIGFCVALGCGAGMLACGGTDTPTASPVKTGSGSGGSSSTTTSGASGSGSTTTGTAGSGVGAGGSGQGGGAANCTSTGVPAVAMMNEMISDFEGEAGVGVQGIMPGGMWAVDTDMTGMTDLKVESCGTTGMGLHFTGTGHTTWGADVAAAFIDANAPVDASQYTGVTFTIKGSKATPVLVKLQNPDSEPPFCQCTGPADCYAGYAKTITVSTEPTPTALTWNQIAKVAWGYHAPGQATVDPKNLISLAFAVDKMIDFDLCIDDVKFTK